MKEKMESLNLLVKGVDKYCNDNGIEYLFAATAEEGKYTHISHNTITNAILKEAAKIVKTIIIKK